MLIPAYAQLAKKLRMRPPTVGSGCNEIQAIRPLDGVHMSLAIPASRRIRADDPDRYRLPELDQGETAEGKLVTLILALRLSKPELLTPRHRIRNSNCH